MRSYSQMINYLSQPREDKIDIIKVVSHQLNLPTIAVKNGIKQLQLTINNKSVRTHEIILRPNLLVKFQGSPIIITRKEQFDYFVEEVFKELKIIHFEDIRAADKKPFCSYIIAYFSNHSFEKEILLPSDYMEFVITELESFYREHIRESKEHKIPKRKELIEILVKNRTESLKDISDLITNLEAGFFSKSLYKFLQEYTKIINQIGFQQIIAPLLISAVYSRAAIESLVKPVYEAQTKTEIDDKFKHFEKFRSLYSTYISFLDSSSEIEKRIFKKIVIFLLAQFKTECDTLEAKPAIIKISPTSRKYNFNNPEREMFELLLNIHNTGEGLAREVKIHSLVTIFSFDDFIVGALKPGESREISISTKLLGEVASPLLRIRCSWLESSNVSKVITENVLFKTQIADVPWQELERRKPYTIQEIEEKDKLYGRDEILKELEVNILSTKIESYKLWGQKRVGKSSIVKTLRSVFHDQPKVIVIWRSIAGLKNTDPILTLNTLGESLCVEIYEEIDSKITNHRDREHLRNVAVPEFNGSLYPLENYIRKLKKIDDTLKFVFILDEFDRINEEFFLPGNLGDSFSLNIGKGLSGINYVGFILVGSENMHLLDRQEIHYNSFQEKEIDTFNKKTEFDSFRNIIIGPVTPFISYSSDAVEKIYDVTNGNPYFANLICSHVFKICFKLKDNEVDIHMVSQAISTIVESSQKSHFEHFWGDGIVDESNVKKERKADIRRRVLVSYSLCFFQTRTFPSKEDIIKNFKRPVEYSIETYEVENAVGEFFNRKIFYEQSTGIIRIRPALFESWLCGPGRTLMIEGVSDLEALQREKQLEVEHALKNEELERVCEAIMFRGEKLKVPQLANYFNQFGGPFEQRRVFNLFDCIYYISKSEITDFIQKEKKQIFQRSELELKAGAKIPYRENVEIYSFSRTLLENADIVETFKKLTLIRASKTLKDLKGSKDVWKQNYIKDIVIFESIIDEYADIHEELHGLFDEKLIHDKIPVKLFVLLITTKAKADLIKATSIYPNFKLIHFKEVEESKIKPFIDTTEIFKSLDESSYAFAEVRKQFHQTSKQSLMVLFESHCPGKSLPVLWNSTKQFKALFPNPFGQIYQERKENEGELYRDRVYHANRELIQAMNPYIINHIREKAKVDGLDGHDNWFHSDYVPSKIMKSIVEKWTEENCSNPKESYFDLIHYKELVKKNKELLPVFQMKGGGDGLGWLDKINEIRRDPAHPEKSPPTLDQAQFFEQMKDIVLGRMFPHIRSDDN